MDAHQWRIVVRTFWSIVLVMVFVAGVLVVKNARDEAQRKADDMVCDMMGEYSLYDEDCE